MIVATKLVNTAQAGKSEQISGTGLLTVSICILISGDYNSVNISEYADKYHVSCIRCNLTNCVSPLTNVKTLMIVQRPPYLMVPVTLNTTWFDSYGLQALQDVNALLVHGRRFIAPLILGITAFIALATSLSLSAIALSQEIHTATFTDQLSKNVPMALPT